MSSPSSPERLKRGDLFLLLALALVVDLVLMYFQPVPGYMDADYYYATGIQLAQGHGFTEPLVWNYLDEPQTLPHPSNSYWYPLASIVSALGMVLTGKTDFISARIVFFLLAVLFPPCVARLTLRITGRRRLALISGILAIFSGYYLPFIVTSDNYAIYMLIGAVYFTVLEQLTLPNVFLLGLLAGLLNLARGDGLIWLPLTILAVLWVGMPAGDSAQKTKRIWKTIFGIALVLAGYLLVMAPWLTRSLLVHGTLTPPGSDHVLWMTNYNQIFSLTPEKYTFQTWSAQGWKALLVVRLQAFGSNLGTAFMAQGSIFLAPLILFGAWKLRRSHLVQFGLFGWFVLLVAESLLFPFASVRGGFFHAGTVFQPLWFSLLVLGLESLLTGGAGKRLASRLKPMFQVTLIVIVVLVSGMLVKLRVLDSGWNEGEYRYLQVEAILVDNGVDPQAVVVVANPPAYNAMTGRQAIVIPTDGMESLLAAVDRFGADYLVLESDRLLEDYSGLYTSPQDHPEFTYLGGFEGVRIYSIQTP